MSGELGADAVQGPWGDAFPLRNMSVTCQNTPRPQNRSSTSCKNWLLENDKPNRDNPRMQVKHPPLGIYLGIYVMQPAGMDLAHADTNAGWLRLSWRGRKHLRSTSLTLNAEHRSTSEIMQMRLLATKQDTFTLH